MALYRVQNNAQPLGLTTLAKFRTHVKVFDHFLDYMMMCTYKGKLGMCFAPEEQVNTQLASNKHYK